MRRGTFFSGQQQDRDNQTTVKTAVMNGSCGTVTLYLAAGALGAIWGKADACESNDGVERDPGTVDTLLLTLVCAGFIVGAARTYGAIKPQLTEVCEVALAVGTLCAEKVCDIFR